MKTITYAAVALLVGPFIQDDTIIVPARGEEGLKFLTEKYGKNLAAVVYFDVMETTFQNLKFTSEPHNQERVDVIPEKEIVARLQAERQGLSDVLGDVVASLTGEQKSASKPARTLH